MITVENWAILPNMLSNDLFKLGLEKGGNNCLTGVSFAENATNCSYRDKAEKWQQKPKPNFIPNMFNDPKNNNNDIYNLRNPYSQNFYTLTATF